jgi:hypothetical protein
LRNSARRWPSISGEIAKRGRVGIAAGAMVRPRRPGVRGAAGMSCGTAAIVCLPADRAA